MRIQNNMDKLLLFFSFGSRSPTEFPVNKKNIIFILFFSFPYSITVRRTKANLRKSSSSGKPLKKISKRSILENAMYSIVCMGVYVYIYSFLFPQEVQNNKRAFGLQCPNPFPPNRYLSYSWPHLNLTVFAKALLSFEASCASSQLLSIVFQTEQSCLPRKPG